MKFSLLVALVLVVVALSVCDGGALRKRSRQSSKYIAMKRKLEALLNKKAPTPNAPMRRKLMEQPAKTHPSNGSPLRRKFAGQQRRRNYGETVSFHGTGAITMDHGYGPSMSYGSFHGNGHLTMDDYGPSMSYDSGFSSMYDPSSSYYYGDSSTYYPSSSDYYWDSSMYDPSSSYYYEASSTYYPYSSNYYGDSNDWGSGLSDWNSADNYYFGSDYGTDYGSYPYYDMMKRSSEGGAGLMSPVLSYSSYAGSCDLMYTIIRHTVEGLTDRESVFNFLNESIHSEDSGFDAEDKAMLGSCLVMDVVNHYADFENEQFSKKFFGNLNPLLLECGRIVATTETAKYLAELFETGAPEAEPQYALADDMKEMCSDVFQSTSEEELFNAPSNDISTINVNGFDQGTDTKGTVLSNFLYQQ